MGQKPRASRRKKGRVRVAAGPEQFRLFTYIFFNFIQRLDRARRVAYASDIELATISEAIALSAIEPLMRDRQFREAFRSIHKVVGVAPQRGVNALSISQATGIPRETTRRKIKKLIELGSVIQVRRGEFVMKPGFLQQEALQAPLAQLLSDTARLINDTLDEGIFVLSDEV